MKKLLAIILFATSSIAYADDFSYMETNTFASSGNYTFGFREYANKDVSHRILRYDFDDSPYRVEYRYVQKGELHEHWYRLQRKWFKINGFWYNHRFEHRGRESKSNVFRYRPQFGYKSNAKFLGGVPFITFEPQWNYNYDSHDKGYSHLQTFTGIEYKVNNKFKVVPYIEVDFDKTFQKEVAFFIMDFKWKM